MANVTTSTTNGASTPTATVNGSLSGRFDQRRYRPLGTSDLFDEAFDLYKSNFTLFLGAGAIIIVPLQILMMTLVMPALASSGMRAALGGDYDQVMSFLGQAFSVLTISTVIYWLFFTILSGASVVIVAQRYLNRPVSLGAAFTLSLRRALPLLVAVVIAVVLITVASAACAIPGAIVLCRYICLPQVLMLEPQLKLFPALRRTWRLTSGHGWRISGVITLLIIILFALWTALQIPLTLILQYVPIGSLPFLPEIARHENLADEVAGTFAWLLVAPFTFSVLTVLYYDIRIRDEGFDMAIIADQLGLGDDAGRSGILPHAPPPGANGRGGKARRGFGLPRPSRPGGAASR